MGANVGQTGPGQGPRGKPNANTEYFRAVQRDLEKRFNSKTGMKKLKAPIKEK